MRRPGLSGIAIFVPHFDMRVIILRLRWFTVFC